MAICGYCSHPGYHAQLIPLEAELSRRCGDCRRCQGVSVGTRAVCTKQVVDEIDVAVPPSG